ncbi:hypothetical protein [Paraferrimonas sp. SM1919]|uniref:hypothetical protein n=1 Tax=Paraferrimonas sp. SM1919 TaxID=2662263 RepID=UPI0013D7DCBD|nr:hypothetical protein [Paraferrimonas sp. SM1919]
MKYLLILLSLTLAGCATTPPLNKTKMKNVESVAIVSFPHLRIHAVTGVTTLASSHFTQKQGYYFDTGEQNNALQVRSANSVDTTQYYQSHGVVGGVTAGIVSGIMAGAEKSANKKAVDFHEIFKKQNPNVNFKDDFIKALVKGFNAKGIRASVISDQASNTPTLRWTALDSKGKQYREKLSADLPIVDADLLIQISPVALYNAPGAMNAYAKTISIELAFFDGRTKEFYGTKLLHDVDGILSGYHSYKDLVKNIDTDGPLLHSLFMGLAPKVTALVSPKKSSSIATNKKDTKL